MIIKISFCFCVGTLLFTAVSVKSDNLENSGDGTLIAQLLERVSALEERDAIQQKLINDLQNEVSNQRKDIGHMKQSLATRDRRIWSLLHSMRRQDTLKTRVKQTEMPESKHPIDDRPSKQEESNVKRVRKAENEITVAFSAVVSKTMSQLGTHQNIVFDHVFTNLGNAYNAHHGVFIVPVSGTYVFFMHIHTIHNYDIWCHFMVNGNQTISLYAESLNSADDTSSQTIILQLKQGDDVAVQLIRSAVEIYGNTWYTSFSGFLLKQGIAQSSNILGLPHSHVQSLLQSQATQFMMCHGAGDFNYQSRDLKNGLHRERKSVAEKIEVHSSLRKSTFQEPANHHIPNFTKMHCHQITSSPKRTVDERFRKYKLPNTSGPQWTKWRNPRSQVRAYNKPPNLPPSPVEPHAEIYIDIHEERMEGLSYTFEEAPMSLTS